MESDDTVLTDLINRANKTEEKVKAGIVNTEKINSVVDENGELNYYNSKVENKKGLRERIYQTFFNSN